MLISFTLSLADVASKCPWLSLIKNITDNLILGIIYYYQRKASFFTFFFLILSLCPQFFHNGFLLLNKESTLDFVMDRLHK